MKAYNLENKKPEYNKKVLLIIKDNSSLKDNISNVEGWRAFTDAKGDHYNSSDYSYPANGDLEIIGWYDLIKEIEEVHPTCK